MKKKQTNKKNNITAVIWIKHDDWGRSQRKNNNRGKALTSDQLQPKLNLDRISPDGCCLSSGNGTRL